MFTPQKRAFSQSVLAASALAIALCVTGCSDDTKTAASNDVGSKPSTSPTSPFEKALDYAQCMRSNGVPSFPDPQQDSGGVRISPGDVDPNSAEYQKAAEACRDKMPQGQGGTGGAGGGQLDSAKVAAWAKCLRENGLTKLPDPEINGSNMTIDPKAAGITPEEFQKAQQACQDKYPGGGLMLGPGPGQ
ncbi:MAG: hypothetical protein QOC85_952 [Streptomyces sp.]|jgi:hypothetical protein|nr:hypothetical protein [Streptomyces sp.]